MDSGQGQLACMSGRDELFGAGHCEPSPNAVLLLLPPPPTLAEMRRPVYKQHSTFWRRLGGRAVATWCELCGLHTRLVQRCAQLEHGCGAGRVVQGRPAASSLRDGGRGKKAAR